MSLQQDWPQSLQAQGHDPARPFVPLEGFQMATAERGSRHRPLSTSALVQISRENRGLTRAAPSHLPLGPGSGAPTGEPFQVGS